MFAELGNMFNTCKRKLLQDKLAIPRQKSNKKEYENLTWFDPNMAYVHGSELERALLITWYKEI